MQSDLDVRSIRMVSTLGRRLGLRLAYIVAVTPSGQTIESIGTARLSEKRAEEHAIENAHKAVSRTDADIRISQLDTLYSTVKFTEDGGYRSETREGNLPRVYVTLVDRSGSVNAKKSLSFVLTLLRTVAGVSIFGIPLLYVLPSPEAIRSRAYLDAVEKAESRLARLR